MQLSMIKNIIGIFPAWTIDDVLETDTKMLYAILFSDNKGKADTEDSFNFIKSL